MAVGPGSHPSSESELAVPDKAALDGDRASASFTSDPPPGSQARCKLCGTQHAPGRIVCEGCGLNLVTGEHPDAWMARRRRRVDIRWVVAGAGLTVLLVGVLIFSWWQERQRLQDHLSQGRQALATRGFGDAEQHFKAVLDIDETHPEGLLGVSRALLEQGKAGDALPHLEAASHLEEAEQQRERQLLLGRTLVKLRRISDGLQALKQAGDGMVAQVSRGDALRLLGAFEEARTAYTAALVQTAQAEGGDATIWRARALVGLTHLTLAAEDDPYRAEEYLREATQLADGLPAVVMARGETQLRLGDWDGAATNFRSLLTHPGFEADARLGLARLELKQAATGETTRLQITLDTLPTLKIVQQWWTERKLRATRELQAAEGQGDAESAALQRALVEETDRRLDALEKRIRRRTRETEQLDRQKITALEEARQQLSTLKEAGNTPPGTRLAQARLAALAGDLAGARSLLEEVLANPPTPFEAYLLLGEVQIILGDRAAGGPTFDRARNQVQDRPELLAQAFTREAQAYARVATTEEDRRRARHGLEQALVHFPGMSLLRLQLARLQPGPDLVRRTYEAAIQVDMPTSEAPFLRLCDILYHPGAEEPGQPAEAARVLEQAVERVELGREDQVTYLEMAVEAAYAGRDPELSARLVLALQAVDPDNLLGRVYAEKLRLPGGG